MLRTILNPGSASFDQQESKTEEPMPFRRYLETTVFLSLYAGTDLRNLKRRRSGLETDERLWKLPLRLTECESSRTKRETQETPRARARREQLRVLLT